MGPLMVVDLSPGIKLPLTMAQIGEVLVPQDFGLQGTVKALVLALGLWVIGPPMAGFNTQPQQQRAVGQSVECFPPGPLTRGEG